MAALRKLVLVFAVIPILSVSVGAEDSEHDSEVTLPKTSLDCMYYESGKNHKKWPFIDDEFKKDRHKHDNLMECMHYTMNPETYMRRFNDRTPLPMPYSPYSCKDRLKLRRFDFSSEKFYSELSPEQKKSKQSQCYQYFKARDEERRKEEKRRKEEIRRERELQRERERKDKEHRQMMNRLGLFGVVAFIFFICCTPFLGAYVWDKCRQARGSPEEVRQEELPEGVNAMLTAPYEVRSAANATANQEIRISLPADLSKDGPPPTYEQVLG